MDRKELNEIREIFDTQINNGDTVIKLNAVLFEKLLIHAETHNAIVRYGGKLPVGPERE